MLTDDYITKIRTISQLANQKKNEMIVIEKVFEINTIQYNAFIPSKSQQPNDFNVLTLTLLHLLPVLSAWRNCNGQYT